MNNRFLLYLLNSLSVLSLGAAAFVWASGHYNLNPWHEIGDEIDSYQKVPVYFNGATRHVAKRNRSPDGYNFGLSFQCVEFVKRFYYQRYDHKMPNSFGHAYSFYAPNVKSGQLNKQRGMLQFANDGQQKIQVDDLLVFRPWLLNSFGHVAIVSQVTEQDIEIVQQNAGPFSSSRARIAFTSQNPQQLDDSGILGWLRLPAKHISASEP